MSVLRRLLLVLAATFLPVGAHAQDREFCVDRPGLGTPACTMEPGRFSVELGLGDWTLEKDAAQRTDTVLVGDILLRAGIADHAEVQIGWTSLGFVRSRDRVTGSLDHRSGTGDVTLALRRNLVSPDGSGFSAAVMPVVTLPTGREPVGAGDWGAALVVPVSYDLSDSLSLATTSEFDAAVDEDAHGRHFAFQEIAGLEWQLNPALTASAEYAVQFDRDPAGHAVQHVASLSLAWMADDNLQFDTGANLGLDHDAPDAELYLGVSRRL